jgi:hypothetical protein
MQVTIENDTLTIVAATKFEASAIRRGAPGLRVVISGIALSQARPDEFGETVITCGVAGALRDDLPTGSVVIPHAVATPVGPHTTCDTELSMVLVHAAKRLGYAPYRGQLLTSATLVRGSERAVYAQAGFAAADMETGFVRARRIAAVRVVLDTPQHEISSAWLRPATVVLRPDLWLQALWLAHTAPYCAGIAAKIVAAAFA